MLYKPMNDNGLHHMLWLSVSLDGHVSLGDGEVRGGDGDGVTTEITVLGGGGETLQSLAGSGGAAEDSASRSDEMVGLQPSPTTS